MSPTSYQLLHPATESLIIRQWLCVSSGKKEKTRKKEKFFLPSLPAASKRGAANPTGAASTPSPPEGLGFAQTPQKRRADHSATRAFVKAPHRPTGRRNTCPPAPTSRAALPARKATIAPTANGPRRAGRADRAGRCWQGAQRRRRRRRRIAQPTAGSSLAQKRINRARRKC